MVTRRDILEIGATDERCIRDLIKRAPVIIDDGRSLREAADHMVREKVRRLIVVSQGDQPRMTAILTRGDLLSAHGQRLDENFNAERNIRIHQTLRNQIRKSSAYG